LGFHVNINKGKIKISLFFLNLVLMRKDEGGSGNATALMQLH